MLRLRLKDITFKGSATLLLALWSLFLCLSCDGYFIHTGSDKGNDSIASNKIELLTHEVRQMKICQRMAENREFYIHKYNAENLLRQLEGSKDLDEKEYKEYNLAKAEYPLIFVDYLLQVGKYREARSYMNEISSEYDASMPDTAQWLNYLCHVGRTNFVPVNIRNHEKEIEKGYDNLLRCYIFSKRHHYDYYRSLSLIYLSGYFNNKEIYGICKNFDSASIKYINDDDVADTLLAGNMAEKALNISLRYNDVYLTSSAWNALATSYFQIGNAQKAIECLNMALANPAIDSIPDLRATICEQLSKSYAAVDNKYLSDFYRNIYLDLQDSTRQDRELEARIVALEDSTEQIWIYVAIAFGIFVLLCIVTAVLVYLRHRKTKSDNEHNEELEAINEKIAITRLKYSDAQRAAVEQRSIISILTGILPLIDRMRNALSHNDTHYALELATEIDNQNNQLTKWIKLRQGSINPKIENVDIRYIFDIIKQNTQTFNRENKQLIVDDSHTVVKADRALTLFMVNTIVDNARKATQSGDTIHISCEEDTDKSYAEISVTDTGVGMNEEQKENLFAYKVIQDDIESVSHGFGLANCRGIIDRYRKISSVFSVCNINVESESGKGTRLSFRLPLVTKIITLLVILCSMGATSTKADSTNDNQRAIIYADSLYACNVKRNHERALLYADSCRMALNEAYLKQHPNSTDTLTNGGSTADLKWQREDYKMDYSVLLSMRNETAVAALALHKWDLYRYNNYIYTQLYKACTADATLPEYCKTMERNELIANIAMLVAILLIVAMIPIFWFVYLRHILRTYKDFAKRKNNSEEILRRLTIETDRLHVLNNITSNQLSTLKHETMYYPTRICQLINTNSEISDIRNTVDYYSELYNLLSRRVIGKNQSTFSFPVSKISYHGKDIIGNEELMSYLDLLLKRQNGSHLPGFEVKDKDDTYTQIAFTLPDNKLTVANVTTLFSQNSYCTDFLIMRQIIREIGNSSMKYGCGIVANKKGSLVITITLPRSL